MYNAFGNSMFPASSSSSAFATGGGGQGAEIQGQSQSSDWGLGGGVAFTGAGGGGGGGGANVGISSSSSLLPLMSNDPSTALTTTAATVETTGTTLGDLPAAPGLFGLIYAGRPVNFDFRAASATGDRFVAEIVYPGATPSTSSSSSTSSATSASAGELTMFLLEALPADKGAIIFYALPPFEEWRVLGTLTSDRASTVFRTGWITDPLISQVPCLQIGVAIDSLDNVNAVVTEQASEETDRLGFAQLVARDLFKYLQSFSQVSPVGERLVIPTDALDKWLKRFEDKYRRNPQFLFKPSDT